MGVFQDFLEIYNILEYIEWNALLNKKPEDILYNN
jgi:hypothetical protein